MLMKSAKMDLPSDDTIQKLTKGLSSENNNDNTVGFDMNSADPAFSLSEIDLNATNFKAIQDPNADPSKVADFEFRLKHTQSTDLMNKVAGLMVQGQHRDIEEAEVVENDQNKEMNGDSEQWPVSVAQLRNQ